MPVRRDTTLKTKAEGNPDQFQIDHERLKRDRAAVKDLLERAMNPPVPSVTVSRGSKILPDHPSHHVGLGLIMQAIATDDSDFLMGILDQLKDLCVHDQLLGAREVNFVLSVIKGIAPKDQLETMLALQMAAVHMATVQVARKRDRRDCENRSESLERALSQLAKTFASQMESLKRYRASGEQKITVQYVSVSDGSQAIVGDVTHAGGGRQLETAEEPQVLTDARVAPMGLVAERKSASVHAPRRRQSRNSAK